MVRELSRTLPPSSNIQLRTHLEYLHLQVLSVASSTQLAKAFQRRSNFDPSRLLDGARYWVPQAMTDAAGTEQFLHNLIKRSQHDFSYLTSSLQPFRMAPALRETAAAALMPPTKLQVSLRTKAFGGC